MALLSASSAIVTMFNLKNSLLMKSLTILHVYLLNNRYLKPNN